MIGSLSEQIVALEARVVEAERVAAERLRALDQLSSQLAEVVRECDEKIANQREALAVNHRKINEQANEIADMSGLVSAAKAWRARVERLERALHIGHPHGFGLQSGEARMDRAIEVARLLREEHDSEVESARIFGVAEEARDRASRAIAAARGEGR